MPTGYKAVTDDYLSAFRDTFDTCDGAQAFTAYPIDYSGGTATPDPAFPGLYVWVDNPDSVLTPAGGGALLRAKGTAFAMAVHHLPIGSPAVPGTRGRVLLISYDTADVLPVRGRFEWSADRFSEKANPFTLNVRVASCVVVDEIDLDA